MAVELLNVGVVVVGGTDGLGEAIRLGKDVFESVGDQSSLVFPDEVLTIDSKILLDTLVEPDNRKVIVENEDPNS